MLGEGQYHEKQLRSLDGMNVLGWRVGCRIATRSFCNQVISPRAPTAPFINISLVL